MKNETIVSHNEDKRIIFMRTRKDKHSKGNFIFDNKSQRNGSRWLKILLRLMTY